MKNKICNIFLCLLLTGTFFIIFQDTTSALSNDYTYIEYNGVMMIIGYNGIGGDITIPSTLGGLTTGIIGDNAFNSSNGHLITSVIIPDCITEIWNNAFYGCNLLESITIGSGVTNIKNDVLKNCFNLNSINLKMQNPPMVCDCWIDNTPETLLGHALKNSNFPNPGETWTDANLIMGDYIKMPPTADFTYTPSLPTENETIQFTDTSDDPDGTIISYSWDFDDGSISNLQNPTHIYNSAGTYTVTLTVIDDDGLSNSKSKDLSMNNEHPIAYFTYNPTSPTDTDTIQFTDESIDRDGTIISYNWDFDDGSTSTQKNPTHHYTDNGIYTVKLTVIDNDGASDTISNEIIVSNIPPTANFTYNSPSTTDLYTIQFTDTSNDPDGIILSWSWNLGDNTSNSGKTIKHTYTNPGTYQVILTVTDNDKATNTKKTTITIKGNNPPTKPTIIGPKSGNKNTRYTFTVTSTDPDNDNIQYTLIWDDENIYQNKSIFIPSNTPFTCSHSWTTPGSYKISVHASDNKTNSTKTYHTILIDIKYVDEHGYLINLTGNNDYEMFYSNETMKKTNVQKQGNGIYLIDSDGNGNWDYTYDNLEGLTTYKPTKTPGFELFIIISAIMLTLFLIKKNKKI